ncbi:hypothetical protein EMIT036CA2_40006 [Chryseobacterium sp. IT-36CA2]
MQVQSDSKKNELKTKNTYIKSTSLNYRLKNRQLVLLFFIQLELKQQNSKLSNGISIKKRLHF